MVNRRIMKSDALGVNSRTCPLGGGNVARQENNMNSCKPDGDCKALLKKLQKIDFSIIDTILYLDSYPECKKAKAYYDKLILERAGLREALAKKCKRPTTAFENGSDAWDWISSPWPWEEGAN